MTTQRRQFTGAICEIRLGVLGKHITSVVDGMRRVTANVEMGSRSSHLELTSVFLEKKKSSVLNERAVIRVYQDRSEHLQSLQLLSFSHDLGARFQVDRLGRPHNFIFLYLRLS